MTIRQQIVEKAVDVLTQHPHGLRYSELLARIQQDLPQVHKNTIAGTIWNLEVRVPDRVYKPARGMYVHTQFREPAAGPPSAPAPPAAEKIKEENFYEPFADWLVKELEECTKAIPVGGNAFKDKWGTPDVIGVREPKKGDIIKFPTEIVSAEVKIDTGGLITAFGQACAYRLFSHKSYIVIPAGSSEDDIGRLDTLARILGIGLILFDAKNPKDPKFEIRVRAAQTRTRHVLCESLHETDRGPAFQLGAPEERPECPGSSPELAPQDGARIQGGWLDYRALPRAAGWRRAPDAGWLDSALKCGVWNRGW